METHTRGGWHIELLWECGERSMKRFYCRISSHHTYAIPPNSISLSIHHSEFLEIIDKELSKDHYLDPFSLFLIKESLGPYQTSPLSMIPTPRQPSKFRLIQNFSFLHTTSLVFPFPLIHVSITLNLFPCTWGKFSTIYLLITHLPLRSEAATWDIAKAYHTIPLHPSQWQAPVVRISDDKGCIDICAAFGASPSCNTYGIVADMGIEIMRSKGIGPLDKWVDDYIFFQIWQNNLNGYLQNRQIWQKQILMSEMLHSGGQIWFEDIWGENDIAEEFSKNCKFSIQDLVDSSDRSRNLHTILTT